MKGGAKPPPARSSARRNVSQPGKSSGPTGADVAEVRGLIDHPSRGRTSWAKRSIASSAMSTFSGS